MYRIDPSRTDLARAFRRTPYGLHGPELQALLNAMRRGPHRGRYAIYRGKPGAHWTLVQLSGERGYLGSPDLERQTEGDKTHLEPLRFPHQLG